MSHFRAEQYNVYTHHKYAVDLSLNLRPEDLYELSAVGLRAKDVPVIVEMSARPGEAHVLFWDGKPVFVWGVNLHVPGCYGLWGFGTKDTKRAMPSITKWGMRTWLPDFLARTSARRIEVRVPVSSVHSINWLKRLGMFVECRLPNYSVVGEDFLQLSYTPRKYFGEQYVHTGPIRDQSASTPACNRGAV